MKMKILVSSCIVFLTSFAAAQTFTEITEGGWGQGMAYSTPVFADPDGDGLLDLIVGEEYGNINRYEQDAVGSYTFNLVSRDFGCINVGSYSAPCFTDLDGDGLLDMIVGRYENLYYYEQDTPGSMDYTLVSTNFSGIAVGTYTSPCIADPDGDGLLDLFVGTLDGSIHHYRQDGVGSTSFTQVSENFNEIDVGQGARPCFTDLNGDGILDLFVGNKEGALHHYRQNAMNSTDFTLISENFNGIDVGNRAAPCFAYIDGDGLMDMVVGEYHGFLNHFEQDAVDSDAFNPVNGYFIKMIDSSRYGTLALADFDNDGRRDMLMGMEGAYLHHLEEDAPGSGSFSHVTEDFIGPLSANHAAPCLWDIDGDDLLDLIVGTTNTGLLHYSQDAVGANTFTKVSDNFSGIDIGEARPRPCFTDLESDGLLDLIIGGYGGTLHHYRQDAEGSLTFNPVTTNFSGIDAGTYSAPCFTDLDGDGRLDLIVGSTSGDLSHYEQDDIGSTNFTHLSYNFNDIEVGKYTSPLFFDINGDGREDLLVGEQSGGVHYFQRDEDTRVAKHDGHPVSFRLHPNHPNPFNPATTIRYDLPVSVRVNIDVYNIAGRVVRMLENTIKQSGSHRVRWDGTDEYGLPLGSGLYICRMQAGEYTRSVKLMLVR